ncbi:MAG TPA: M28 family peptidase [Steroidobacteraceae bacterium]|nr:M28 family peptidase [Steroidobacteraceae bacterium]
MAQFKRGRAGILVLAAGVAATVASADSALLPPAVQTAAHDSITQNIIEAPIRYLADDLLEGRGPSTRGDQLARLYLASQLRELGYEPGGPNGSYQQPFDIVSLHARMPKTWSFNAGGKNVDLAWSADYIAASGVQADHSDVKDAELVFVGYGIEAPEYQWDDFKGVDVKGKMLVVLNNDPDWDPKLFEGKRRLFYGRWVYKYENGGRHGAAGVIIVHTTPSAGYPWQVVQTSWGGAQYELPDEGEPRVKLKGWATEDATRRLFSAAGKDLDKLVAAAHKRNFRPVPLGIHTSIAFDTTLAKTRTGNVAGLLRGSDPKLASEVVVYSAHHDHLGIRDAQPGEDPKVDRIYNGAEDNASGCAQILAIARAFKALPERPRRSTLILFVGMEEQGLLGSLYYAMHPTFAPGKIAANINVDGGNAFGRTHDISQVGGGKSSLDAVAGSVIAWQGRVMTGDQSPDKGHFYRSDQFNFAKIGVPALYFDSGTDYLGKPAGWGRARQDEWLEKDYHQPSDQIDSNWNFDGMIEDSQFYFYTGWLISQADALPKWNAGDEFEATRKKALTGGTD